MIQPIPPPRVSPATPVWVTMPLGTARPNACVARSTSPSSAPAWTRAVRASGSTLDVVHRTQVDHDPVVADREPREAVPAAAHGDRHVVAGRAADGGDHVVRARAPGDEAGRAVDGAVPDPAVLGVRGVSRRDQLAVEVRPQAPGDLGDLCDRGVHAPTVDQAAGLVGEPTPRGPPGHRCPRARPRRPRAARHAAPAACGHHPAGVPSGRASSAPPARMPIALALIALSSRTASGTLTAAPACRHAVPPGPVKSVRPGPRRSSVETRPPSACSQT